MPRLPVTFHISLITVFLTRMKFTPPPSAGQARPGGCNPPLSPRLSQRPVSPEFALSRSRRGVVHELTDVSVSPDRPATYSVKEAGQPRTIVLIIKPLFRIY